ncbi:hypothetical protein ACFVHW_29415 [Streptomyces sp. NPDC127110]
MQPEDRSHRRQVALAERGGDGPGPAPAAVLHVAPQDGGAALAR